MWRARRPPVNVVAGRLHMSLPSNAHAGGPQAQLACPHLMAGMTSSKIPWHPPVHPKQPGGQPAYSSEAAGGVACNCAG